MLANGLSSPDGSFLLHRKSGGDLVSSLSQFQYGMPRDLSFKYLNVDFRYWIGKWNDTHL